MRTFSGRRDTSQAQLLKQQHPASNGGTRGRSRSTAITKGNHSANDVVRLANARSCRMAGFNFRHSSLRFVAFVACWFCCFRFDFHTSSSDLSEQYSHTSAASGIFFVPRRQQQELRALLCEGLPLPSFKGAAAATPAGASDGGAEGAASATTNTPFSGVRKRDPYGSLDAVRHLSGGGSAASFGGPVSARLADAWQKDHQLACAGGTSQELRAQKRPEREKEEQARDEDTTAREGDIAQRRIHRIGRTKESQNNPDRDESMTESKTSFAQLLQNVRRWILGKPFQSEGRKALTHADEKEKDKNKLRTGSRSAAEHGRSMVGKRASIRATHGASSSAAGVAGGAAYLGGTLTYPLSMTGAARRFEKRLRAEGMFKGPRWSRSTGDTKRSIALPAASSASPQPQRAISKALPLDGLPELYGKARPSTVHVAPSASTVEPPVADVVTEESGMLHEMAAFAEKRKMVVAESSSTDAVLGGPLPNPGAAGGISQIKAVFPYMGITAKVFGERSRPESMFSGLRRTRETADSKHPVSVPAPSSAVLEKFVAVPLVLLSAGASTAHCVTQSPTVDGAPSAADLAPPVHVFARRLAAAANHAEDVSGEGDGSGQEQSGVSMLTPPQGGAEPIYAPTTVVTENVYLQPPESENEETLLPEISRSRAYRRRRRGKQPTENAALRSGWGWTSRSYDGSGAVAKKEKEPESVFTQSTSSSEAPEAAAGSSILRGDGLGKTFGERFDAGGAGGLLGAARSSSILERRAGISETPRLSSARAVDRGHIKGIHLQRGEGGESQLHLSKHEPWRKWGGHALGSSRPAPLVPPSPQATRTDLSRLYAHTTGLAGTLTGTFGSSGLPTASKVELARQRYQQQSALNDMIETAAAIQAETGQGQSKQTAMPDYSVKSVIDLGLPTEGAPEYAAQPKEAQLQAAPLLWQQDELQLGEGVEDALQARGREYQRNVGSVQLSQSTLEEREAEEEKEVEKLLRQKYIEQPLQRKQRWKLALRAVVNLVSVAAMALVAAKVMDTFSINASTKYLVLVGFIAAVLGERILRGLRDVGNTSQLLVQDAFLRGERQQVLAVAEALRTIEEQNKAHEARERMTADEGEVNKIEEGMNSPPQGDPGGLGLDDPLLGRVGDHSPWL